MRTRDDDLIFNLKKKQPHKRGFTLIELIVVMAVIAILVLLAAPKFLGYSDKTKTTQITSDIKVLETQIDEYVMKHDNFPDAFKDGVVGDGQLYDRTGKIDAVPDNLKVVDGTFYPETKLPGTFYTDPDGKVVYEDDKTEIIKGDSEGDKEPVGVVCSTMEYDSPVLSTESDDRFLDNVVHVTVDYSYGISKSNNKQIIITKYLGSETDVIIPCRINGLNVVEIGSYLLSGSEYGAFSAAELTSVTIPYGVVKIGREAFSYSKLTSLIIPDTVVEIGIESFYQNKNLTSVTFGKDLEIIDYGAFQGNALTSVSLPPNLKTIGSYAFQMNETIEELVLNEKLENIGPSAFEFNKISSDLVFPETLKTIGMGAFKHNQIKSIFIPESVMFIDLYAFNNNPTVKNITVSDNNSYYMSYDNAIYTKDGNKLLTGSSSTKTILPVAEIITEKAFCGMGVTTITLGNNLKSIEWYAFIENPITSIVIPGSVTEIGMNAFRDVPLTSLTLNEGLRKIRFAAFWGNNLTELTIPGTVTTIESFAFFGNSIDRIYLNRPSKTGLTTGSDVYKRNDGGIPIIDYTPWN